MCIRDRLILQLKEDNADEKAIEELQIEIQEKKQYLEERKKLYRIR